MSSATGQTAQQLRHDIQHELTSANQLARLISKELQLIKIFTNSGGEFESNLKQNAGIIKTLANTCHIDIENIPPLVRRTIDLNVHKNQNQSHDEHNTFRNESEMDETQ